MDGHLAAVVSILQRESRGALQPGEITGETPLFEGGFELDSLALLETILSIEEWAGIRLREEDVTQEMFATVADVVNLVQRRKALAAPPP